MIRPSQLYFRVCRLMVAAVCICIFTGSAVAAESDIAVRLDSIDSKMYVESIEGPVANYAASVEAIALEQPEIQYLLQHSSEAIPVMLHRMSTPGAIHYPRTMILYFIIFRQSNDRRVLPAIADYLDSAPASAQAQAMNGDPFEYAFWAACSFLNCDAITRKYGSRDAIFPARHELAGQLRLAYKQQNGKPPATLSNH